MIKIEGENLIINDKIKSLEKIITIRPFVDGLYIKNHGEIKLDHFDCGVDEVYEELRANSRKNFLKIKDSVLNLDYVDSCYIQLFTNDENLKVSYSLFARIDDRTKERFDFDSHIDAERYYHSIHERLEELKANDVYKGV